MTFQRAIVSTLVLASAGATAAFFAFGRGGPLSATMRGEIEPSAPVPQGGPATSDKEEIRRLRAELQTKERLLRALATQAAAREGEHAAALSAAVHTATRSPMARATAALDARLEGAPANGSAKAELERALRLEPKGLGPVHVDDLRCAGRLCKIALSGPSDVELRPVVNSIAERIPKGFAATQFFPTGEGAQAIYLGRSGDDLAVEEAPLALP